MNAKKIKQTLRLIRAFNVEDQGDMAAKLGVSRQFLSAVESGKKRMPSSMVVKLHHLYGDIFVTELDDLIAEESRNLVIDLTDDDLKKYQKKLAILFAIRFRELSKKECEKIENILARGEP